MRHTRLIAAVGTAAGLLLAGHSFITIAHAQSATIQVSNAWARRAAMSHGNMGKGAMSHGAMDKGGMGKMDSAATGAIYVTISNTGKEADALLSVSTDAAQSAELHEVKHEGGMMKMRPVEKIGLPAGGKIDMKPGGYHVMLLGLTRDLKPGDKVAVTLKFEHGGDLHVDAAVR